MIIDLRIRSPVFYRETRYTIECGVVGHQYEADREGMRSNQAVKIREGISTALEISPQLSANCTCFDR